MLGSSGQKARENSLRRKAKRLDLLLCKSRNRQWSVDNELGYMLVDPTLNAVVAGQRYELTLDDVADWLDATEKSLRENARA